MPLIIQEILPRSLAARGGIKPGDKLLSINGHDILDFIDLQYYGSEPVLDCELEAKDGTITKKELVREDKTPLGIEPEDYRFSICRNKCIFCFIDQMPPSLRKTLYDKDDDYLYSFVFGNYISLTNLKDADYNRIIKQKLSPLYVSVHTTNPELRAEMMGYKRKFDLMDKLHLLSDAGIQLHCQLVLVPDWNDMKEFERSLNDLIDSGLNISSIGVVPVGLTRYRKGLVSLRTFRSKEAENIISITEKYRSEKGINWLYCADELFILADIPIPESHYYQDYPQVENGIGMVRLMLEIWKDRRRSFFREIRRKGKPLFMVTGVSAFQYIESIAEEITGKVETCPVRVQKIINNFMGETVTVSGLLTFNDIKKQAVPQEDEIVVIPANIFNHEGITLDGFSQTDIKEYWKRDILIVDPLFDDWEWL